MECVGAQNVGAMAVFTRPRLKPLVGRRVMPRKKQSFWRMSSMKVKCNSSSGSDSCVVDKEDFADEEDYIKAGGSQLVFVQMQQKKDMDQQSKLSDEVIVNNLKLYSSRLTQFTEDMTLNVVEFLSF